MTKNSSEGALFEGLFKKPVVSKFDSELRTSDGARAIRHQHPFVGVGGGIDDLALEVLVHAVGLNPSRCFQVQRALTSDSFRFDRRI